MKSIKFDGSVGVGQIIHGIDNGESMYIYATYADLNTAFNFGAKNKDRVQKVIRTALIYSTSLATLIFRCP